MHRVRGLTGKLSKVGGKKTLWNGAEMGIIAFQIEFKSHGGIGYRDFRINNRFDACG